VAHPRPRRLAAAFALTALTTLTACSGAGGGGGGGGGGEDGAGGQVNVLMVNNPQMVDLQRLTSEFFTPETGITVNFTVLPENDVRDSISQEFASQAGQYDVASISNYEVPFFSANGWLAPLDEYVDADSEFDQDDILEPMTVSLTGEDGSLYAEPFYGESSFLMYRTDVFEEAGITMPEEPTWQEVADIAAQVDNVRPGMRGICLRGLPGWGQVLAPLTTVVNTFGGTYWDESWNSQVNSPQFTEATQFYVDLVRTHGQAGAPQSGFTECLNNMQQGNVAMWYDATSAAGSLESPDSPVKGMVGYAPAPVKETASSGWLYTWAWGIQEASRNKDAAWEFVSWASSKEYEELVGAELGWSRVPAGKRASTYQNEEYLAEAGPFAEATQNAIESADPANPGTQPRPAPGIQFVAIPEFAAFGTDFSQQVSSAIAGQISVEDALARGQQLAEQVATDYRESRPGAPGRDCPPRGASMSTATASGARADAAPGPRPDRLHQAGKWARRAPLLPALIFLIILTQIPFLATLIISFLDWNALRPNEREFAGFGNYATVLTDPALRSSIFNTVELTVVVVLVSLVLGLILALLLDRSFRGRGIARTLLIAPFLIVPIASALTWKHALLNPSYGLFNGTLTFIWRLFGAERAPQPEWITSMPMVSIELALIWQWTPFMMLILLAGLQGRPLDVIEAAKVDGASALQIFRYLTLPHLRQYLELAGLLGSIYIVQNFDAVFTITAGGLGTANLPYTIYQTFFAAQEYGEAAAAGVVVVIGTIIIATFALRVVSSLFQEETSR
jgi:sorbitol/mannitol transport system substrate-binding protein